MCYHRNLTEIDMALDCSWAGLGRPGKRRLQSMLGADGLLFYLYLFRDRLVFYEFKLGFVSLSVKTTSYKYVTIPDE